MAFESEFCRTTGTADTEGPLANDDDFGNAKGGRRPLKKAEVGVLHDVE